MATSQERRDLQIRPSLTGILAVALVGLYWASSGLEIFVLRALSGSTFLIPFAGLVVLQLLVNRPVSAGMAVLYSTGLGLVFVSSLSVVLSTVAPFLSVATPLSPAIVMNAASLCLLCLLAGASLRASTARITVPEFDTIDRKFIALFFVLLCLSVEATVLVNEYRVSLLMYGLIIMVCLVAALLFFNAERPVVPIGIFALSVAVLFHRSLLSAYVVGFDIQLNYYTATLILEHKQWSPTLGGSFLPLTIITAVPATLSSVTGMNVHWTLKIVHPLVFALTPVGIYYLFRRDFGGRGALFGALTFLFYYRTFYNTPGKQLMAEFFLLLLLCTAFRLESDTSSTALLSFLFGLGLVQSHHGVLYIAGGAFLVAAGAYYLYTVIAARTSVVGRTDLTWSTTPLRRLTPRYALLLITGGTGWYVLTSERLSFALTRLPLIVATEIRAVLLGETVSRSASGVAQSQTSLVRELHVLLFVSIICLTAVGVLVVLVRTSNLTEENSGVGSDRQIEFVALTVPFYGYLLMSVFISGLLGTTRLYQISLIFIAPFGLVGLDWLTGLVRHIYGSPWLRQAPSVVLIVVLLFNSGLVYTATGTPISSDVPFDRDTHSQTYWSDERAGAEWVATQAPEITRQTTPNRLVRPIGSAASVDAPPGTIIHTDQYTAGMFQAISPTEYYNTVYPSLKYPWAQTVDPGPGFVYVRTRSVLPEEKLRQQEARHVYLSRSERASLLRTSAKIYDNSGAEILWRENSSQR